MTDLPGNLQDALGMIKDLRLRLSGARALAAWAPARTKTYLFVGGPRHGETLYAEGAVYRIAVPFAPEVLDWSAAHPSTFAPSYTEYSYERRSIGVPAAEQTRTVYVLRGIGPAESLRRLRELALVAWIAACPDS